MNKKIFFLIILAILIYSCSIFRPKDTTVSKDDIANYPNLVELTPGDYLEINGMKNYTPEQIKGMILETQQDRLKNNQLISACSQTLTNNLGFEDSNTFYINPNLGIISTIESIVGYGIEEFPLPPDSLATIERWNIPAKDLTKDDNNSSLNFLFQFLRTDGERLSMKYKTIFKTVALPSEKLFYDGFLDHINSLQIEKELPIARKVLQTDRNIVNRTWALLIIMRTTPSTADLDLLFREMLREDQQQLRNFSLYVTFETLKLKDKIQWVKFEGYVKSLINGGAVTFYGQFLNLLLKHNIDRNLSQTIITQESPLLKHTLNSIDEKSSKMALDLIKYLSNNKVKDLEGANIWLTNTSMKNQNK